MTPHPFEALTLSVWTQSASEQSIRKSATPSSFFDPLAHFYPQQATQYVLNLPGVTLLSSQSLHLPYPLPASRRLFLLPTGFRCGGGFVYLFKCL